MADALPHLRGFLSTFEQHEPGDPEVVEVLRQLLEERTDLAALPDEIFTLWAIAQGEPQHGGCFPMLRLGVRASETDADPPLDEWIRLLDGLRLLSADQVLEECERLDASPLADVEPSWVPVGEQDGDLAFLDGPRLLVWNRAPWDDELGRGHIDCVLEDFGAAVRALEEAVAAGRFQPKELGPDWAFEPAILYEDRLLYTTAWEPWDGASPSGA